MLRPHSPLESTSAFLRDRPFSSARAPGYTIELIDRSRRISRGAPFGQGCRGAGCQADLIHWPVTLIARSGHPPIGF